MPIALTKFNSIAFASVITALALSACEDARNNPDACLFEVSEALDNGDWEVALEKIDSEPCQQSMSRELRELNRAAAFIGRAGYELTDLIEVALSEPDPDELFPDLRFVRLLGDLGRSPGALRDLDLSLVCGIWR